MVPKDITEAVTLAQQFLRSLDVHVDTALSSKVPVNS